MSYSASPNRYDTATFSRVGKSGLVLPPISFGLWHNFGDTTTIDRQRAILLTAFDHGITHFDLANNYGPPAGSAEINFGHILKQDLSSYRDELIISTKAGWDMWPGPYGRGGGSRKALLSSLDQSLKRLQLDYVDIFYSHRFDANTPLEETADALASAVHQGKALYVGISSYSGTKTREIAALLAERDVPLLINQPSYNLFNRWIEQDLLAASDEVGAGVIAFTPLAQGLLTAKYLNGVPSDARVNRPGGDFLRPSHLSDENIVRARALNEIAARRGQSLAQLAIAWVLRDRRVTSALIGASSPEQIVENLGALNNLTFTAEELAEIDRYAVEGGVNLWEKPSTDEAV
ncbi:L-glyceraldehyde 3-phosphate reductase [Pararhizobium sp. LjRoot238]|uniref:L-glyceraldehyde 3-phosphate reductase n=1 Tax=Pararhizobium sp. LjRoot238 TaxID=3342293 RepID=UPI003ECEBAD2